MADDTRRKDYRGPTDALNLRVGFGEQIFKTNEGDETYIGSFKRDAYHGIGQYLAHTIFKEPWSYEGRFNVNRFEGYGILSFADNSIFSGLYKNNRAFGPGVLTNSDGRQDVGLWSGSQILRLSVSVSSIQSLSKTARDRLQALRYKKLVRISCEKEDLATEILLNASASDRVLAESHKLYSRHCRNPESHLFDKRHFQDDLTDLRNVEEDLIDLQKKESKSTEIVKVGSLYKNAFDQKKYKNNKHMQEAVLFAWNNQAKVIDMMKHSFKHRRQECVTHFNFSDILCNRRSSFAETGEREQACIEMLLASEKNDVRKILDLLRKYHLNVDVMDNKGNSMALRAAANDAHNVIRMLSEVYCDIDAVNDEGFSALTHTLTRYLAVMYDIKDWAKGFMPPLDSEYKGSGGAGWMEDCMRSQISVSPSGLLGRRKASHVNGIIQPAISHHSAGEEEQTYYLFDFEKIVEPKHSSKDSRRISRGVSRTVWSVKKTLTAEEKKEMKEKLKKMEETTFLLLNCGADVNASVTPAPVWVLALYTGSVRIVEELLKHGIDPNAKIFLDKASLTPLHILVLAKPLKRYPKITDMLLQYGANPHLRTNPEFRSGLWRHLKFFEGPVRSPEGMTPLHALILRPDAEYVEGHKYLDDVGCILAWNTNENEMFYGLTPLGLAIAQGSLHLMRLLLQCSKIQINNKFDDFWGNPLTTYLRTQGTSTSREVYKMLDYLLDFGADPLEKDVFPNEGNILNFASNLKQRMLRRLDTTASIGSTQKFKTKNQYFLEEKRKLMAFESKERILMALAKKKVERHIKGVLVRTILYCMQKKISENPQVAEIFPKVMNQIGNWITFDELPDLVARNLEISEFSDGMALVNAMLIFPEIFPRNFSDNYQPSKIIKFMKKSSSTLYISDSNEDVNDKEKKSLQDNWAQDFREKLHGIKEIAKLNNYSAKTAPEVDTNGDLYKVCYECLQRNPNCLLCPDCQLVYFCSLQCNINDVKNPKSRHKCKLVSWGLGPKERFVYIHTASTKVLGKSEEDMETKRVRSKTSVKAESVKDSIKEEGELLEGLSEEGLFEKPEKSRRIKHEKKGHPRAVKDLDIYSRKKGKGKKVKSAETKKQKFTLGTKGFRKRSKKHKKAQKSLLFTKEHYKKMQTSSTMSESKLESPVDTLNKYLSTLELNMLSLTELVDKKSTLTICPEIDYEVLGGKAEQEEYWEKSEETKYPFQQRLQSFLCEIYKRYGNVFDIEDFFPFVTYRFGNLYYKFYRQLPFEDKPIIENYSFN